MILFLNKVTFWTTVLCDFNISNPYDFHPKCPHALFILSSAVPENRFSLFTEALWIQTICIIHLIPNPPSPAHAVETSHFCTVSSFLIQEKKKINDWYVGQFLVLSQLENKGSGPS